MLPAGLYFSLQDRYAVAPGIDRETAYASAGKSEHARRILELVFASGGSAEQRQIREAFGTKDPNPALRQLTDHGVLQLETSAERGVGDKTEQVAVLAVPAEEAMAQVTPKRRSAPLRYAVVELLAALGSASSKELCYFTGASSATLQSAAWAFTNAISGAQSFARPSLSAASAFSKLARRFSVSWNFSMVSNRVSAG